MNSKFRNAITLFLVVLFPFFANAMQESRPLPGDSHLRVMTFNPNAIHHYVGYYEYGASIVFEEGEEIQTISMGDTGSWQIVPSGNRMFIKPIAQNPADANTNMLLITNKRVYHFILEAAEVGPDGINDPDLVFQTTFLYPSESDSSAVQNFSHDSGPDLSDPSKYNFNYTISGSQLISPIRVFDDGRFTYIQFEDKNVDLPYKEKNADLPAIFLVDSEGKEALINYRMQGDYMVIERIGSLFTLRHGKDVVCLFNENKPYKRLEDLTKKNWF